MKKKLLLLQVEDSTNIYKAIKLLKIKKDEVRSCFIFTEFIKKTPISSKKFTLHVNTVL